MIIKLYERDMDGNDVQLASINTERFQHDQREPVIDVHGEPVVFFNPFGPDPETPVSTLYAEVVDE
jgi:hypothetical protein